jgi:hypothetical protein
MKIRCIEKILGTGAKIENDEVIQFDKEFFTKGKIYNTVKPFKPEKEFVYTELYVVDNFGSEFCIGYCDSATDNLRKNNWLECDKFREHFEFV